MSETSLKSAIPAMVNALEYLSSKSNNVEEGDYIGEDGLLYCGKCHTRKQSRINILGEERTPFCMCKCKAEKVKEEERRREIAKKAEEYRDNAFDDREMLNWTFANDDGGNERVTNAMKRYCDNFSVFVKQGKGLLLYGDVGRGKTYAAVSVVNELINRGYPCKATDFKRIENDLNDRNTQRNAYLDEFRKYALLVIDDLGAERKSEYMQEIVYNVIDSRYRWGLPFIVTTNLSIEEIKSPTDMSFKRIYSRILERCHPVLVDGKDRRRMKIRNEYDDMNDLLGL